MRRSLLIVALAALMVMAFGASAAFAGEINGRGERPMVVDVVDGHTILHGKSACAFSGLNDTYAPGEPDAEGFLRTQNWGQVGKTGHPVFNKEFLTSIGLHPGQACNPTRGDPEH